jgi:hypothetical protein
VLLDGEHLRDGQVAWAAFHGDVDHEVSPIEDGHRVTLTYALHRTGRPRAADEPGPTHLRAAVASLLANPAFLPKGGAWLLPCARRVIQDASTTTLTTANLVGRDRTIAQVLTSLSLAVTVRPCVAVVPASGPERKMTQPLAWADVAIRLKRPLEREAESWGEMVTLAKRGHDDEGKIDATSLLPLEARSAQPSTCLVRRAAQATLVHEAIFSSTGYFGNDHYDAWLYTFAAMEVDVPDLRARGLLVEPARPRVRHVKFGEGVVLSETPADGGSTLEVQFADGSIRKILARFLERLGG